ncbi:MAG: hypothetical protein V2J55_12720 [Candidatus Competibacteraceae bacterium]|nr:hypothetical protein [Candidatus Competibacteraceae bacterium]
MRVLTLTAALLITAIITVTAFAESEIPDLKGEWVMTHEAVIQSNHAEMPPERHVDENEGFISVDFVITIDKQEGIKFSGIKSSKQREETISGIIGFDNRSVYMVDDDGIMHCRIVGPDKMEQIYLHVAEHRSVVGRGIMTRKR